MMSAKARLNFDLFINGLVSVPKATVKLKVNYN